MNPRKEYNFMVIFEPAEEGGYLVTCPALPGLVSQGDTLKEARDMAEDAILAYIESLQKDGLPIPEETHESIKERITINLPPTL